MTDTTTPAIELVDVRHEVGSERILDDVNLAIPAGSITALLGPSGAGKTVTVKHILGLMAPTRGAVRIEGRNIGGMSDAELYEVRRRTSVVLQGTLPFTCGLFFSLSVYENVSFPLRERTRMTDEEVHRVTMQHLGMVGLRERADLMPDQLSSGMAKRVAIARALALKSPIVIIDDFDSGIDGVRLALICEILADAQAETGATFLITTHDMDAARRLATHAAVIHNGRIVMQGEANAIFDSDDPLVHQLVAGSTSGPIELSST
jgi:phospholipid/cholesterol/gamma-HCH transport system ATP-binding protein